MSKVYYFFSSGKPGPLPFLSSEAFLSRGSVCYLLVIVLSVQIRITPLWHIEIVLPF